MNQSSNPKVAVVNFYSFFNIDHPEVLLPKLLYHAKRKNIKGTILIAQEGVNGSIAGEELAVNFIINEIINLTNLSKIQTNKTFVDHSPFEKLKIKIKPEIVTLGVKLDNIAKNTGTYISPAEWDNFIMQSDVVLVDTRNIYEIEDGTFKNAVNPYTNTFRQFPEWVENNINLLKGKKIAMCCTGGIRCEKSTAYLKDMGFKDVYHLKGGILTYLAETKNKNKFWKGNCFVFDERRVLTEELLPALNDNC